MRRSQGNRIRTTDDERLKIALKALEETNEILRDLTWEASNHRPVDREMQLITNNEAILENCIAE